MGRDERSVDWECQNCGEYYSAPANAKRADALPDICSWCGEPAMWEVAEHDQNDVLKG